MSTQPRHRVLLDDITGQRIVYRPMASGVELIQYKSYTGSVPTNNALVGRATQHPERGNTMYMTPEEIREAFSNIVIGRGVKIERGVQIGSDVVIGRGAVIERAVVIGSDAVIGSDVRIGSCAWIGSNAVIVVN